MRFFFEIIIVAWLIYFLKNRKCKVIPLNLRIIGLTFKFLTHGKRRIDQISD